MRLWSVIFSAWFCLVFNAGADGTIHLRTTKTEQYLATYWTTEQGLPQNTVNCLIQTHDGYIWAGTRYGLVRFDGVRFTTFFAELNYFDPDYVNVHALAEDAAGCLWLRTQGGLVILRDGQFSPVALPETPFRGEIRWICSQPASGMWVAKDDGVLLIKDGKVSQAIGLDRLAGPTGADGCAIRQVFDSSQGALWVLLSRSLQRDFLWQRFDLQAGTVASLADLISFSQPDIAGFTEGPSGQWWLGRPGELMHWENGRLSHFDASQAWGSNEVHQVTLDARGDVWIASSGQVQLHRFSNGQFTTYGRAEGIIGSDDIRGLLSDREGNLWVGTGSSGLNRLQPRQMVSLLSGARSTMDEVFSISSGHDGRVWLATTYGLVLYQSNQFQIYTNSRGFDGKDLRRVRPVLEDHGGRVWFGLDADGLHTVEDNLLTLVECPYLGHDQDRLINSLYETRDGTLWMTTRRGLVEKNKSGYRLWTTTNGLSDDWTFGLTEGPDGSLWIGTRRGGVNQFKDGRFRAWLPSDGLLSAEAWPLLTEPDGALWIGTPHGLHLLRNGQIRAVTSANGLYDDLVYCLLEDRLGNYWSFSNRGIWRMKKAQLRAVAEGSASRLFCVNYGEAEGMASSEGNGDDCPNAAALDNGELWFPTTRGAVIVNPEKLRDHDVPPLVVVEEVQVDEEVVFKNGRYTGGTARLASESIRLAPGRARVLAIHYTANTFIDSEKVRFQFQLLGHDEGWREADTQRVAIYTNLRPGDYRFRVQACNPHGYWSQVPAEILISLAPHFYQTWPFRGLCALAIVSAVFGWHFRRVSFLSHIQRLEQQQALQDERSRIAKDLHDDLGASLTGIALETEIARREVEQAGGSPTRLMNLAQSTRTLVDRMREVIWTVNPLCDTLESFCIYLCGYAEGFLGTAGVRCRLDFPVDLPSLMLSAETRHQLLLVAKEALNNAVKHAAATEVRLGLKLEADWLILSFEDNGRGFTPSNLPNEPVGVGSGRGLNNMRRRADSLGGSFDLSSQTGLGTRITLRVPLPKNQ